MKHLCVSLLLCTIFPSTAAAQSTRRFAPGVLVGGLSYGVGDKWFTPEGFEVPTSALGESQAVPGHERGLAKGAFFGILVTRRVSIVFEGDFPAAGDSGFSSRVQTVGIRYWPASRIWVGGGLGVGALRYKPDSDSDTRRLMRGLGLNAGTGIEILHWGLFALEVQARVSTAEYGQLRVTQPSIQLGYEVWLPLR